MIEFKEACRGSKDFHIYNDGIVIAKLYEMSQEYFCVADEDHDYTAEELREIANKLKELNS